MTHLEFQRLLAEVQLRFSNNNLPVISENYQKTMYDIVHLIETEVEKALKNERAANTQSSSQAQALCGGVVGSTNIFNAKYEQLTQTEPTLSSLDSLHRILQSLANIHKATLTAQTPSFTLTVSPAK